MRMLSQEDESDDAPEVTWPDQQRINAFAKYNTRIRNTEDLLQGLKQEKEALDDLAMEIELADEDTPVLYRVGDTFIHISHAQAMKRLEHDNASIDTELDKLNAVVTDCEANMRELKIVLYAKFGQAINLDE